jgi:hypothetical protein
MISPDGSFTIVAFDATGQPMGRTQFCAPQSLLGRAADFESLLSDHGEQFEVDVQIGPQIVHLRLTGARGAALGTLTIRNQLAGSFLLLAADQPRVEHEVLQLFHHSLTKSVSRLGVSPDARAFESLFTVAERPLLIVVPWGGIDLTDDENEAARDITIELATAYFHRSREHRQN